MKNKSKVFMIGMVFLLMIINAVAENVRGVFVPFIREEFLVTDSNIGTMMAVGTLGYVVSTFIGGWFSDKFGQKKVLLVGSLMMVISLFFLAKAPVFIMFIIGMFLLNIGLGLTSIAVNTLVPILLISFQAVLMNITHFCYGLGASLAPTTAGIMIDKGWNWRNIYFYLAIVFIAIFFMFLFVKIPSISSKKIEDKDKKSTKLSNKKLLIFYIVALGFYVAAERGTADWFVNYLTNSFNYSEAKCSIYVSLFFAALTFGRLCGGIVAEKLGYVNSVLKSIIFAFILYIIGLMLGAKGIILVSISGVFFAIVFPTLLLTISKVFKENTSFITGVVVTFACAINMIMSFVIGKMNDIIGYSIAIYVIPVSLIISGIFTCLIYLNTKKYFIK